MRCSSSSAAAALGRSTARSGGNSDRALQRRSSAVEDGLTAAGSPSVPQFFAGEARALCQRFELCPHDRGVDPPVERSLREAAIRSGEHVLASEEPGVADDALGNELGMLHHVGGVADDARDEHLARRQLHILPYLPFVLVTG